MPDRPDTAAPSRRAIRRFGLAAVALLIVALGALYLVFRHYQPQDAVLASLPTGDWRSRGAAIRAEPLPTAQERLKTVADPLPDPGPADWLANHNERGQSYRAYTGSSPVRPDNRRRRIYLMPIGPFDETQQRLLTDTRDYLSAYFQVPVVVTKPLPLSAIPDRARRDTAMGEQLLTRYILDDILKPNRPEDAVALIGLTATDLWPGRGWNFVFGQASLRDRVGVWSMARYGDPSESEDAYRAVLRRTCKVASHETGHILGIRHCIAYACNMNGSNNLPESDRTPLQLCPSCNAKLTWNLRKDPAKRAGDLAAIAEKAGLDDEAARLRHVQQILSGDAER